MPLQHTHPDMLKAMRRPRHEPVDELIHRMRDRHPNLVIRTTFITGFPGETEEHHEHMLEMVRTLKMDHVGAFSYSPQEGTPGAKMKPVVVKRERDRRRNAVMREQQAVSMALHQGLVGQVLPMLVEGVETDTGRLVGRTHRDAPEIDGTTFATSEFPVFAGEVVPVRITQAEAYDLHGEVVTP
ncbi:Ribosomal protein S12 methylthiotransferase RimO [compost metagenome]